MKPQLLIIFLLLAQFLSGQTTLIPDMNFEQELIDQGIDTNGATGDILNADAESVTDLDVSSAGITSLAGIEAFKNLTDLDCDQNQLTTLDVNINTELKYLSCNENQLSSVDVSACEALVTLKCDENKLTSIDVNTNTKLLRLSCDDNLLINLDVTKNIILSDLSCKNNQLSNLDLSLTSNLRELYCFNNKLFSLDVSGHANLWAFECGKNLLASLDVSANTELKRFYCENNLFPSLDVSANSLLKNFICGSNQLSNLDVSLNTDLEELVCSNNQLTSLDVSANPAMWKLDCRVNQLTSLDVSANEAMSVLICDINQLTSMNMTMLNLDNINFFKAKSNPGLTCISVDDPTNVPLTISDAVDAGVMFSSACETTSTKDISFTSIKLFPNPTTGFVHLENISAESEYMRVYDNVGQLVYTVQNPGTDVNISHLNSGMYYIVISEREIHYSGILIKE